MGEGKLASSLPHLLWGWEVELELLCLHFCHLLMSVSSLIAQVPGVSSRTQARRPSAQTSAIPAVLHSGHSSDHLGTSGPACSRLSLLTQDRWCCPDAPLSSSVLGGDAPVS